MVWREWDTVGRTEWDRLFDSFYGQPSRGGNNPNPQTPGVVWESILATWLQDEPGEGLEPLFKPDGTLAGYIDPRVVHSYENIAYKNPFYEPTGYYLGELPAQEDPETPKEDPETPNNNGGNTDTTSRSDKVTDLLNKFADSTGNPAPPPDDVVNVIGDDTTLLEDIANGIAGLLEDLFGGGDSSVVIPIPGLPVSIPGNMSIEDIMVIANQVARQTGRAVEEVLGEILEGIEAVEQESGGENDGSVVDPGVVPVVDPVVDGPTDEVGASEDDEDDTGVGVVIVPEDEDPVVNPVVNPVVDPVVDPVTDSVKDDDNYPGADDTADDDDNYPGADNTTDDDDNYPGADNTGDDGDDQTPGVTDELDNDEEDRPELDRYGEGMAVALPFLLGLLDDDSEPPTPDMIYHTPDRSWGIDRPDYGQVDMAPIYNFGAQPVQPIQVGYNTQERNEWYDPVRRAMMQQRGLL